ncbi:hypothetical protein [Teredinibacter haidensis]|uniref:hypothetical protein n=1 Tax=Teredinibacter haidensis TaxID=2731755 RepID=UPI000948B310|nr:hypothetical protein [Teredinibacter haidensis]
MNNVSVLHQVLNGEADTSKLAKGNYDWLLSEYREPIWKIQDPGNLSSPIVGTINFDGPLIGGGRLIDIEGLVDDLKLSLVFAVEFSAFKDQVKIRSCSAMRNHVYILKRVFNEIYDMQGCRWDRWLEKDRQVLVERLKYKPSVSQNYLPRLTMYIENVGIENLPVRKYKGSVKINYDAVFGEIGIDYYQLRGDLEIQKYLDEVYVRYNKQSISTKLKRGERALQMNSSGTTLSRDRYEDVLRAVKLYQAQTSLMPDQYVNASRLNLVYDASSTLRSSNLKPSNPSRTRNIPVPVFLHLVDASIRYILDYADTLFEIEDKLALEHKKLTLQTNSYEAGKIVNAYARELGEVKEGRYSPFPLAAYKHFQIREKNISDEDLSIFHDMVNSGLGRAEIRKILGLSKGQYDYRSKVIRNIQPYGKNLPHKGISLQKALYQFLPLSCLIVIFAFSARRESEVFGMRENCYQKFQDGWRVKFYVAKSLRRHEWFTSVPVVIKAIKTLEALSEEGRKISRSDSLYRFNDTFNRSPINMDRLNIAMEPFLDFIGVEKGEGGERFKFSEHQFRRFFAIMYFYRYEKQADLEALTYELRHEDWSNTAVYLTEQESGRIFREVEKEYMAEKLVGTLGAESEPRGVLRDLSERIKQTVDVVPENRSAIAMKYIEENSLRMDFISEGICFGNTPGRSELSRCYSDGYVMCHRSSSEVCTDCPNLLPIENIRNDKKVAAIENLECDNASILDAAISYSNKVGEGVD